MKGFQNKNKWISKHKILSNNTISDKHFESVCGGGDGCRKSSEKPSTTTGANLEVAGDFESNLATVKSVQYSKEWSG